MNIKRLSELNINISKSLENSFLAYEKSFLEYNSHTNLISKNDEKVLFEKHIYDSLAINLFSEFHKAKNLLDIGTGGGFPAVPAAIAFPDITVVGVDSVGKKVKFINSLNIENLSGVVSRTEDLPLAMRDSFDIVTSRAVAPLNIILEYGVPYLKKGGYFVAYKSKNVDEEIKLAQNALKILGCDVVKIIDYNLPIEENFERNLVVIKKNKPTPSRFPRRAGMAKINPL